MREATKEEIEQLEKVREKCLSCKRCSLCQTRTNSVFSGGVPNHKLMLIGEAPLPEEKEACKEFLDAQIEILKPRIILLCGRVAVQSILNSNQGITKIRGKWFEGPNMSKMMPIFHPSYLLRNDSRDKGSPKWLMWQDIQEIKRVYSQMD